MALCLFIVRSVYCANKLISIEIAAIEKILAYES